MADSTAPNTAKTALNKTANSAAKAPPKARPNMDDTAVKIVEVGPRDGLQNEAQTIDVSTKIDLIERLTAAGAWDVEAGAFVSPKWTPQMADSDKVLKNLSRKQGTRYLALTPNMKGYAAAREAGVDTIAVFGAASETFSHKNINASIQESLERFKPVIQAAQNDGLRVRGYVSCIFACPYEGDVPLAKVVDVSKTLYEMGCEEISLGDTIGVGTPFQTTALIRALGSELPLSCLAGHFHDTYGQALANIYAAIEEGLRIFDASIAGLGGCPYAKGASGNVATEDVVYMLSKSGFETGLNLEALIETSWWISSKLGRRPSSKLALARRPQE